MSFKTLHLYVFQRFFSLYIYRVLQLKINIYLIYPSLIGTFNRWRWRISYRKKYSRSKRTAGCRGMRKIEMCGENFLWCDLENNRYLVQWNPRIKTTQSWDHSGVNSGVVLILIQCTCNNNTLMCSCAEYVQNNPVLRNLLSLVPLPVLSFSNKATLFSKKGWPH